MKSQIQRLSLLLGTIALSVSIASALPTSSQSTNPTTPPPGMRMGGSNFLILTAEQETKMQQIRQNTRSQIDGILTAEQKAQLQRDRENRKPPAGGNQMSPPPHGENGGNLPAPFASLNLTKEQRAQIEAVMRSSKEQMDAVLTPEQRQQLQQFRQQQQQRRQKTSSNLNHEDTKNTKKEEERNPRR